MGGGWGAVAVEEDGRYDHAGARQVLQWDDKAEQKDGGQHGQHDGQGGGEVLEDVIGVLHHHGHQEPPQGIQDHQVPDIAVVAKEEALALYAGPVGGQGRHEAKRQGGQGELHISHPDGNVGAFQDFFKVNASKSRATAGANGCNKPERGALVITRHSWGSCKERTQLYYFSFIYCNVYFNEQMISM